jgi:hypothetical protein
VRPLPSRAQNSAKAWSRSAVRPALNTIHRASRFAAQASSRLIRSTEFSAVATAPNAATFADAASSRSAVSGTSATRR